MLGRKKLRNPISFLKYMHTDGSVECYQLTNSGFKKIEAMGSKIFSQDSNKSTHRDPNIQFNDQFDDMVNKQSNLENDNNNNNNFPCNQVQLGNNNSGHEMQNINCNESSSINANQTYTLKNNTDINTNINEQAKRTIGQPYNFNNQTNLIDNSNWQAEVISPQANSLDLQTNLNINYSEPINTNIGSPEIPNNINVFTDELPDFPENPIITTDDLDSNIDYTDISTISDNNCANQFHMNQTSSQSDSNLNDETNSQTNNSNSANNSEYHNKINILNDNVLIQSTRPNNIESQTYLPRKITLVMKELHFISPTEVLVLYQADNS